MELRHLRYFAKLADELHFTRAAERLRVTQSTLSHQIRQLEEEVGSTLFNRTGREVQLSPAGQLFRTYARRILQESDAAVAAVHELDALKRGALRIGVIHTLLRPVVMPALAAFVARYPGVQVRLEESSTPAIEAGLVSGEFDFGVGVAPARSSALVAEPLFDEDYCVIVGPGHPLASRTALSLAELRDHPLIMLTQGFVTRRVVDVYLESQKVAPGISVECNNLDAIFGLLVHDTLATVLPVSALFDRTGCTAIPIRRGRPSRTCAIFWPRASQRSVAALTLAQAMVEHTRVFKAR